MLSRLAEEFRTLAHAVTFYTRLPLPLASAFSESRLSRCTLYFPMMGWLVGGFGALTFWGATLILPKAIALVLSMIATLFLTGALHEDGFADFCDGFGGGWTKERILEIMKDSRLGTYGVLGLISILSLKWLTLMEMAVGQACLALISGHSLSRFLSASLMRTHAYVGDGSSSKSKALCMPMSNSGLVFSAVTGLAPLLLFREAGIFLCLFPLVLMRWGLGTFLNKKIGGFTGDCLGAAQQIFEISFYLLLLIRPWTSI